MSPGRVKKTLMGIGIVGLGLAVMFISPYAALHLSDVARVPSYFVMYLGGFIGLLYGTGQVLVANNLWGD